MVYFGSACNGGHHGGVICPTRHGAVPNSRGNYFFQSQWDLSSSTCLPKYRGVYFTNLTHFLRMFRLFQFRTRQNRPLQRAPFLVWASGEDDHHTTYVTKGPTRYRQHRTNWRAPLYLVRRLTANGHGSRLAVAQGFLPFLHPRSSRSSGYVHLYLAEACPLIRFWAIKCAAFHTCQRREQALVHALPRCRRVRPHALRLPKFKWTWGHLRMFRLDTFRLRRIQHGILHIRYQYLWGRPLHLFRGTAPLSYFRLHQGELYVCSF